MYVEVVTHNGKIMDEMEFACMKEVKGWFRKKYRNDMIVRIWYSEDAFMNMMIPDVVKGEGKARFKSTEERTRKEKA